MMSTLRPPIRRLFALAAVALLAAACASGGARPTAPAAPSLLYGIAGNHLVRIDPATGTATGVANSPDLVDVGALTYDPGLDTFYAVASATTDPALIAIDRATGEVMTIGAIDLPGFDLTRAEGLAFDPRSGRLYAAAGQADYQSDFASDRLLLVDVTTGSATELARIRGTRQGEADALTFAGGKLFAVDVAANTSSLYILDPETGEATAVGSDAHGVVTALAHGAAGQGLYAVVADSRELVVLPMAGGEVTTLGTTHGGEDFGGAKITALALAQAAGGPHRDSFETGDLSAWSVHGSDSKQREQR